MLQVNKIGGGGDALRKKVEYLIKQLQRQGRYYLAHEELSSEPAHWGGGLAATLGLAGREPNAEDLMAVLLGEDPRTEQPLLRVTAQGHQPGLELTTSIPKGWSIAWAAADEATKGEMEGMFRRATERLVATIEADVPLIRRGRKMVDGREERVIETAKGILVGYFPHMTSRQTLSNLDKGLPPDMQSHYHIIIPSLVQAHDGTWHAVDSYSLTIRQRELDATWQSYVIEEMRTAGMAVLTQTELEHEQALKLYQHHVDDLQRIGLKAESFVAFAADHLQRTGKPLIPRSKVRQFHLRGFSDPRLIRAHSAREKQVEENLQAALVRMEKVTVEELVAMGPEEAAKWTQAELDKLSAKALATIVARAQHEGRLRKLPLPRDIVAQWQTRLAREFGVTAATVRALFLPQQTPTVTPTRADVWRDALEQLPQSNAYVDWDGLRALLCTSALRVGYPDVDDLRHECMQAEAGEIPAAAIHEELVVKRVGRTDKITTKTWLATERRILDGVRRLRDAPLAAPTLGMPVAVAARPVLADMQLRSGKREGLTDEQKDALETILSRRVSAVRGEAGAGKGKIAEVAAAAWRQAEPTGTIYALAVSGLRAVAFRGEVGADRGTSFESFALDVASGRTTLGAQDLLVVDEGSMVDSSRFALAMDAITGSGTTPALLLIGDPEQMKGIGASGLFQEVEQITGTLDTIERVTRVDGWDAPKGSERRQRADAFIGAQKAIRISKVDEALAWHAQEGHLRFVNTPEEARDAAVAEWATHYRPERHGTQDHPVIDMDRSNVEIDALAASCQNIRLERGDLDPRNFIEVRHEDRAKDYVREQRIFAGATVVTTDKRGRERRRETPGDLVRLTSKVWAPGTDGKRHELRNGREAEVVAIRRGADGEARAVQLRLLGDADKQSVVVTLERPSDWNKLRVAYARYTEGDQGGTRWHAPYMTGRMTSRASFYVGDTRGKVAGPIFSDRRSLGLEPGADEEACRAALARMLKGEDEQQAALTISEEYLEERRLEVEAIAARQAALDAERSAIPAVIAAREAERAEREEEERIARERAQAELGAERAA